MTFGGDTSFVRCGLVQSGLNYPFPWRGRRSHLQFSPLFSVTASALSLFLVCNSSSAVTLTHFAEIWRTFSISNRFNPLFHPMTGVIVLLSHQKTKWETNTNSSAQFFFSTFNQSPNWKFDGKISVNHRAGYENILAPCEVWFPTANNLTVIWDEARRDRTPAFMRTIKHSSYSWQDIHKPSIKAVKNREGWWCLSGFILKRSLRSVYLTRSPLKR